MNRIIKFRAWHIKENKMFYPNEKGEFSGIVDGERICSDFDYTDLLQTEVKSRVIPMQYTGVLDRVGKAIYEGDVVETPMGRIPVTFEDGCFYTSLGGGRYRLGGWQKEIEVVGNIYESFDTLKSKS